MSELKISKSLLEKPKCMRCYFMQNGYCRFFSKLRHDYKLMDLSTRIESDADNCKFYISDDDVFESAFDVAIKKNEPKVEMKVEPYYDKKAMDEFFDAVKRGIDVEFVNSLDEKKEENV